MKIKSKQKIFIIFILLISLNSFIGCNNNPNNINKDGIVMYVGNNIFENSLDPIKGGMSYGYPFINDALLQVNKDSGYEGDLADSYEVSDDALEYTFKLKQGIKFSDGSDFNAEDVVFTYQTVKDNQGENENVDLTKLASVKAEDDYTVKFILSEPYSPFIDTVACLGIVPSDNYDSKKFDKYPIGTGAYKVVQYDANQQIIVEANDKYYGNKPEINKATLVYMDPETAFSTAKSGQLDVVMVGANYSSENIDGMTLEKFETMDVRNISLPTLKTTTIKDAEGKDITVGNDVTSDINVRKALSIGLDRKTIIKNAFNGVGKIAEGFTDNLIWANTETYDDNQVDQANKILDDAGWIIDKKDGIRKKDGIKCEFNVYAPSSDNDRYLLATATAEDAKKLGIRINVKQATWDEILTLQNTAGVVWGWGQYSPTVLKSLFYSDMFQSGAYDNVVGYSNDEVDKQINNAINANNQEDAINSWKNVQEIANKDYPYLYLVNIEHCYFINNSLDISKETQIAHPHGHGSPIVCNMKDWKYK